MYEAKHTKAPWRIINKKDKDYEGAMVVTQNGYLIADCNIFSFSEKNISKEECLANARLIAAAPVLLEACKIAGVLLGKIAQSKTAFSDEAMAALSWIVKGLTKTQGEKTCTKQGQVLATKSQ